MLQPKNIVKANLMRHNLTFEEFARRHGYNADTVKAVVYKDRQYGPVARKIREDLRKYEGKSPYEKPRKRRTYLVDCE